MEYVVKCIKEKCVPTNGLIYQAAVDDPWQKKKPTHGIDINYAHQRVGYLNFCHSYCGCLFDIEEI